MTTVLDDVDDELATWLEARPVIFVATAPSEGGHLNLSPKGGDGTFRVLDPLRVAYVDLYGSGAETAAHLRDDGRIVLMACAFEGRPRIVRLHGTGQLRVRGEAAFDGLRSAFTLREEQHAAVRGVIEVTVHRVSESCGYTVPEMTLVGERTQLYRSVEHRIGRDGPDAIATSVARRNATSIDGLPAYPPTAPGGG